MKKLTILAAIGAAALAVPAVAQQQGQGPSGRASPQVDPGRLMFYDQANYNGVGYEVDSMKATFQWDYNIRSIGIHPGERWQVCAQPHFRNCIILDRSIPDATMVGITGSIGSVRPAPADAHN
jgi:hypothetical protein